MMKKALIVAAVMAAGTVAHADDSKHFDGFHLGGEAGYLHDNSDLNGVYYGAFAGYRKQLDSNMVIGVEGTFGKPDLEASAFGAIAETDHIWTAMGTLGFVTGTDSRNLWSLGAGYAQTRATATFNGRETSDTGKGVAGFVGFERAMGDNLSLRARATTYEFESFQGTIGLGLRF